MGPEAGPGAAPGEVVSTPAGEPSPSASRGQASGRPRRASPRSQAEIVGEEVWGDGLKLLFRLAEAMAQGMTAATGAAEHAELTAVACLMMLERVNYLLTVEVRLPRAEMEERIAAIMFAAFNPG